MSPAATISCLAILGLSVSILTPFLPKNLRDTIPNLKGFDLRENL
jgi:hypothetical protein